MMSEENRFKLIVLIILAILCLAALAGIFAADVLAQSSPNPPQPPVDGEYTLYFPSILGLRGPKHSVGPQPPNP